MTLRGFQQLLLWSLCTVYLVILAGSVVRATGSGMGCPDWPKCFGQYIPPTDISELPLNYTTKYAVQGHDAEFNAVKTWIEYVNRLVGAVAGLLIFIQCIASLKWRRLSIKIPLLSFLLVLLMGFQALLGAGVVWTFLLSYMITLHMLAALVIVLVLLYLIALVNTRLTPEITSVNKSLWYLWVSLIGLTLIQVFLGTEVREKIDGLSTQFNYMHRELWIDLSGTIFLIHRSFSILIIVLTIVLWKYKIQSFSWWQRRWFQLHTGFLTVVVVAGIGMAYGSIPAWLQPVHFFFSCIVIGIQWYFVFRFMIGHKTSSV